MSAVSPARAAAHAVVVRALRGAYADRVLRAGAAELDGRDRALAKRLAFGAVQRRGTLDWVLAARLKGASASARAESLARLEDEVRAALHLGLYELLFARTADHAAVAEAVELAKPSPGHRVVNAVLRRVARDGVELPADDEPEGAAIRHAHPSWLVHRWFDELGADDARALLAADNEPAELALRVNPLADFDGPLPAGRRDGDALVVDGPLDVAGSEAFAAGAITPMSRAAQLVAPLLDPRPGERVLDLCAAPGGKTAHLAALMGDRGTVVAVERDRKRATALERACARLRATCVEVVCADATTFTPDERFDRVLLDPPCSGLGTLRTHPDLRWRMTPQRIETLVAEQDALLAAARRALKPGGALVYSTCTISVAEERLAGDVVRRTLPHRDGTDGFYIARIG